MVLVARDLIRPVGPPSPKEKGEIFRAVRDFTLLPWRRWREAPDEVFSLIKLTQPRLKVKAAVWRFRQSSLSGGLGNRR
jgi:hypothetical protein